MRPRLPRIWLITLPENESGPVEPVRRALVDRARSDVAVLLRAPGWSDRDVIAWGRELRTLTSRSHAALFVHGRPDLAQVLGADGVHLPENGLPVEAVRAYEPRVQCIGVSRHDRPGLEQAEAAGADYAFLSPIHHVPGKNPAIGVDGFARATEGLAIRALALGGIKPDDLRALGAARAYGIAVRRAIYDARDPREALDRFVAALDNLPPDDG